MSKISEPNLDLCLIYRKNLLLQRQGFLEVQRSSNASGAREAAALGAVLDGLPRRAARHALAVPRAARAGLHAALTQQRRHASLHLITLTLHHFCPPSTFKV